MLESHLPARSSRSLRIAVHPSLALPVLEQDQLATVRQRRYVVSEVQASELPVPALDSVVAHQHLVTLNAIDDDAVGESVQVIREVGPGAETTEKLAPRKSVGFDQPAVIRCLSGHGVLRGRGFRRHQSATHSQPRLLAVAVAFLLH